ncbi:hypothetical protein IV203_031325 [Nitzschia inconspicua]|uniref:Uncharacterized protein n=1 Tax=Nitzschia inconspicua TaxID=303405 RepID=A0A9K3LUP0_9STRA|nr:hypothetical protein IV203_031325 [Nitzschia inconspicua]
MNGGRPVDMIERLTVKPVTSRYKNGYDVEEEDGDDILNEAMDQFFLSESLELGYDNEFRDSRGRFQCQSILTRCHGSHRCGKNLVVCLNVQSSERFIVVEATETRPSETNETDFSTCNRHLNVKALNELALKVVTRVVDKNGRAIDMGVNGTLENVRTRKEYRVMENKAQDVMYAAVGEAHVSDKCKKYHDPLLKLYLGRPLCINQNEDVSSCIANGAMCEFRGVKLKPGASMDQFETIVIHGYYVYCVSVTQVESLF